MQLDRTAIVIRERGQTELLDLALHVTRAYGWRLPLLWLVGALPFFLYNRLALGGLPQLDPRDYSEVEVVQGIANYIWQLTLLTYLQAPLATALATLFLGRAAFFDRPSVRGLFRELWGVSGRLLTCQGILRLSLPASLFALGALSEHEESRTAWAVALFMATAYAFIARKIRPFLSEIILLEKNPWRARPGEIGINQRNTMLHANAGQLFFVFLGMGLVGAALTLALHLTVVFLYMILFNGTNPAQPMLLLYVLPAVMWGTVGLLSVFRFLSYLDLRIRQEGWAVELRMRAEAAKLQSDLAWTVNR